MTYTEMRTEFKSKRPDYLHSLVQLLTAYEYSYADYGDSLIAEAPKAVLDGWIRNLSLHREINCQELESGKCVLMLYNW